jgi:hypothetical protein
MPVIAALDLSTLAQVFAGAQVVLVATVTSSAPGPVRGVVVFRFADASPQVLILPPSPVSADDLTVYCMYYVILPMIAGFLHVLSNFANH